MDLGLSTLLVLSTSPPGERPDQFFVAVVNGSITSIQASCTVFNTRRSHVWTDHRLAAAHRISIAEYQIQSFHLNQISGISVVTTIKARAYG